MPDLRELRTFVAVAEERNFTRAAERLHLAQQAVSKSVGRLERELGVELLERTTREVRLTAAGAALLESGREALASGGRRLRPRARRSAAGWPGRCASACRRPSARRCSRTSPRSCATGRPTWRSRCSRSAPATSGACCATARSTSCSRARARRAGGRQRRAAADAGGAGRPGRPPARRRGGGAPGGARRRAAADLESVRYARTPTCWCPGSPPRATRVEPVESRITGSAALDRAGRAQRGRRSCPRAGPAATDVVLLALADEVTLPLWCCGRRARRLRRCGGCAPGWPRAPSPRRPLRYGWRRCRARPTGTVLVAGAGPVGLLAACELARRGTAFRLIDRLPEPTTESRAIVVHARSLEMLATVGAVDALIGASVPLKGVELHSRASGWRRSASRASTARTRSAPRSPRPRPSGC